MTDEEFEKKFPNLDIIALLHNDGRLDHEYVPEHERNFDNGTMPSRHSYEVKCLEWIDGKQYVVYK